MSTTLRVADRMRRGGMVMALGIAGVFVAIGLYAIAINGWTELYADQWRSYTFYLERPFPASVMVQENGHRPVLPGLIRVAELRWLHGNQWLQLIAGALFAFITWAVLAVLAWLDREADPLTRAMAIALAGFAIFWLGNSRMLLHGNESVHVYVLTACLAGAIGLCLSRPRRVAVAGACVLAVLATFTFGSGLAVFMAAALVLAVQRRYRAALGVALALGLTLALYLLLPGAAGVRNSLSLDPLQTLLMTATWLSSMPVNLFIVLLDESAGNAMPGWVSQPGHKLAYLYTQGFGDIWTRHGPAAVLGLLAVVYVLWATWSTWRSRVHTRLRLAGLGLTWFAMAVGGIVTLSRLSLFTTNPGQVFANRYLPWSCLFWLGVGWIALGSPRWHAELWRRIAVTVCIVLVLGFGLLTTGGNLIWGALVQNSIRLDAVGVAVGVVDAAHSRKLGETMWDELREGLPAVREAKVSMFAWPESQAWGKPFTATLVTAVDEPAPVVEVESIGNDLEGGEALKVRATLAQATDRALPDRLLLVDAHGMARGILMQTRTQAPWNYVGYSRHSPAEATSFSLIELSEQGSHCWSGCSLLRGATPSTRAAH
ncbi:MAG: hypothetical protein ABIY56_00290 [Dokdonella sp.]